MFGRAGRAMFSVLHPFSKERFQRKEYIMKMLIVDDERTAIRDLEILLKKVVPTGEIRSADNYKDALSICKENRIDVAFLDVSMPGKDGISLAREIKECAPDTNIVMVTAYTQYALDAMRIFVSGYIVKPALEKEVRQVLANLRNPVSSYNNEGLYVKCFGNFEVYYNGEIVKFTRKKSKELFAYLVDRRGASATNAEIRAAIWDEESIDESSQRNYFTQITRDLRRTFEELGCEDVLLTERNSYAVDIRRINCDYYKALEGDAKAISQFENEYMKQYVWAESKLNTLANRFK